MQCIAKRFPPADHVLDKRNEYETLLAPLKIPDGVFVLNLTDAVILRADGMHPFPNVVGVLPLGAHNYAQHLPIFSLSGQHGYLDICIPNYDDVQFALGVRGARELQMDRFVTVWARKRHARAVFRGGPTGCGYTPETNARIRVAMMDSPMLDAGITMLLPSTRTIDSLSLRFDPKHGLGMLNTGLRPAARLEMWQQSEYKYMLHIDGNVSAYRLLVSLATGSLILRVTSAYTSWLDDYIEAGVHYVAVSAGADDLLDVLAWCKTHDAACRKISRAGLAVARDMLDRTRIEREFERIFAEAVSKREEGEEHISSPIFALDDLAPAPRRDGARCPDGFARTLVARERVCARKTRRKVHGA
jgi:hypothetical protein